MNLTLSKPIVSSFESSQLEKPAAPSEIIKGELSPFLQALDQRYKQIWIEYDAAYKCVRANYFRTASSVKEYKPTAQDHLLQEVGNFVGMAPRVPVIGGLAQAILANIGMLCSQFQRKNTTKEIHEQQIDMMQKIALTALNMGLATNQEVWVRQERRLITAKLLKLTVDQAKVGPGVIHVPRQEKIHQLRLLLQSASYSTNPMSLPAYQAAYHGDLELLKAAVRDNPDIDLNEGSDKGETPLHLAVKKGHKEIVSFLLENDVKLNLEIDGRRALDFAFESLHSEIVNLLIKAGAQVSIFSLEIAHRKTREAKGEGAEKAKAMLALIKEAYKKDKADWTPLHHAAFDRDDASAIKRLIEGGNQVNAKTALNETALFLAACCGHDRVVAMLLSQQGIELDTVRRYLQRTALFQAASSGFANVVNRLIVAGADVNLSDNTGRTPLYQAARYGHQEAVFSLLKDSKKVKVNTRSREGYTPLTAAAQMGEIKIAAYLIDHGADLHVVAAGRTPLDYAIGYQQLGAVELLLDRGAVINESTLQRARETQHSLLVKLCEAEYMRPKEHSSNLRIDILDLIHNEKGVQAKKAMKEAYQKSRRDWSPLHIAVWNGDKAKVIELIKVPGSINVESQLGETPLFLAVSAGHREIAELLLQEEGVKVDVQTFHLGGRTALYQAARYGHHLLVRQLINKKANPNLADREGRTPLYQAALNSNPTSLQYLLDCKEITVNASLKNKEGVLHAAVVGGSSSIVTQLIKKGVKVDGDPTTKVTPLDVAIIQKKVDLVKTLLQSKAKVTKVTELLAKDCGCQEVVTLIERVPESQRSPKPLTPFQERNISQLRDKAPQQPLPPVAGAAQKVGPKKPIQIEYYSTVIAEMQKMYLHH